MTGDVPTETGLPDDTKTDLPEDSTATDSPEGATMTEDPTMSETGVPEEASSTAYETVYVTEGANATMTGSLPEETSLDATATDEIAPEETGLDATATDESLSEETGLAEESEVGVANVESTKAGMPTKTVAGITGPGTGSAVPATTRSTLMTMVSIAPTKPVPSKTHGQDLQVPTPSAVRRRWL
ncbi:hypothetical protein K504DRAFT_188292 [Pleomassaria siparia CBS 279.74]|uniref:Uncharacterized protein n=1 Tax=Pleomassaria siparia CBS 279.74 TaxID=1314801 RepID=A0A6G1JRJ7_9PLEO|nr:hypothetical protein K504DRAFT_188292 [Pleomassaria siparia CBS 279.74]